MSDGKENYFHDFIIFSLCMEKKQANTLVMPTMLHSLCNWNVTVKGQDYIIIIVILSLLLLYFHYYCYPFIII